MSFEEALLPYLPVEKIRKYYENAGGHEIESGKFEHPESSAALVANVFGYFLDSPERLPSFPARLDLDWPPQFIYLEQEMRFPWRGGLHPWLDAAIETSSALIGIESKRYEPFRSKSRVSLSEAYWRNVWGSKMEGYQKVRDDLNSQKLQFDHLDAAQLVKHALGLLTQAHRRNKKPVLIYLFAEPESWPDGRKIAADRIKHHRQDIEDFAGKVADDAVKFAAFSYCEWFKIWPEHSRFHADNLFKRFNFGQ